MAENSIAGAREQPNAPAFAALAREKYVLLTTFRRDGVGVGTPVHVAVEGDLAYFRTWDTTWKLKRIRNNPQVEVAPSTFRGRQTGPGIRARARILAGAESARAGALISRKHPILHGFLIPLVHRIKGNETMHVELMADS
ncbi:PPOX class F420-dependent oxidoreductase [Rubrobacter tropicus]|uniref:PPOX class F420-dependent oxidoreductase n=1 Tax=Rubrobacter tropicus TaxID=2653851 RepID=A0A6G8Q6F4_9ACTN|nr:PPOX class F420-dependent oxidoreductase [Rubrobacter tropicus]QIN82033.1 PPOX class F420-dependent oxidoreductase [Rubrobacter tropicus]